MKNRRYLIAAGRFSHAKEFATKNRLYDWDYIRSANQLRGVDRGQFMIVLPCAKTNDQYGDIIKMARLREFVIKRESL